MALAREALTIVIREQKGCLQSFETDEIGRLMAADRICRLVGPELRDIHDQYGTLMSYNTRYAMYDQPAYNRAASKLLKLAADYIDAKDRTMRAQDVISQFRLSIDGRKRACKWERFKRADALCAAYVADIAKLFTAGVEPTLREIQERQLIMTPSGLVYLTTLRVPLVAKLQRLVPELYYFPDRDICANDSGNTLMIFMDRLDQAGCCC